VLGGNVSGRFCEEIEWVNWRNVLILGSTTFFGARFCRHAVVEKADLAAVVIVGVIGWGCGDMVLRRAFGVRYLQRLEGRKTSRKAEGFMFCVVW
jgi:hypothetical protein